MHREPSPRATFRAREGVSSRRFDGDLVILDLQGGNYFGLDEVGSLIWEHLMEGRSGIDTASILAGRYEAATEEILDDVMRLVNELLNKGLVELAE
jgi:hypothetical protein